MTDEIEQLAVDSLRHLEREEQLLGQLQVVVRCVRTELLSKSTGPNAEIGARQTMLMAEQKTVGQARSKLREEIARTLSISKDAATVSALSSHCASSVATEIQERCNRLQEKANELNAMLIANGNLAFQLWELLERVFRTLEGDQPVPQVYQRNGHRRVA